jgi:hypothetical protein
MGRLPILHGLNLRLWEVAVRRTDSALALAAFASAFGLKFSSSHVNIIVAYGTAQRRLLERK